MIRRRIVMIIALAATIGMGLASRADHAQLPRGIQLYAGDTLWAAAAYISIASLVPAFRRPIVATLALALSVLVEFSQLYHAPWIDSIRSTRIGALLLGHGFLWTDLLCYSVGVLLALAVDALLTRATRFALIAPR